MLVALRATHEHLDLEVLDALTRGARKIPEMLAAITGPLDRANNSPLLGWVVIATCNRLEIYLDAERFHDGVDLVIQAIAESSGIDPDMVSMCLDAAMGPQVAEHLYEVMAGLRSVVVGEAEITGQVRTAFGASLEAGHTTAMLNDLFQVGFRYAKRVVSHTKVGVAGRSGASVALDRAEEILGSLRDVRVLVVGTGAYARLGVSDLARRGCTDISVFSGSGRAESFAQSHDVHVVPITDLSHAVRAADLVLACSGRGTSLFPECFFGSGPTLVLDLALHSDLHALVRHMSHIRVIGLTDIAAPMDQATTEAIAAARAIVAEGVERFQSRQEIRKLDPAVSALRATVRTAMDEEIARLHEEHEPQVANDVERRIRRIFAKVMHSPTMRAQQLAREGQAQEYVAALHTLFGIEVSADGLGHDAPVGDTDGWMRVDQTMPPRFDGVPQKSSVRTDVLARLVRNKGALGA
ncbi:glutamyl-tRNA reductase [Devriesea agamarum]|uniref:glutamyl-tRNA reductase n=1 Tax=Devriesea agamarum TaxID=472569 RepID=UPI00071CDA03|nr:glutamyl-tRNA reductase [Devriesea agamarum]